MQSYIRQLLWARSGPCRRGISSHGANRYERLAGILAAETGVEPTEAQRGKHVANHAAYPQSWVKALCNDTMAVFSAAKDAEKMAEYVRGLERQASAMRGHAECVAAYDR